MLRCERCGLKSIHIYDGFCSDCLSALLEESEKNAVVSICDKAHQNSNSEKCLLEQQVKSSLFGLRRKHTK